jgi:hypothetical protein
MATILERCNELGIQHDKKIRSFVGERVSKALKEEHPDITPLRVDQTEDNHVFKVNDYPRHWQERMDYVIILACAELYKSSGDEQ